MYLFIYLFNQSEVNGKSIRVNPANICWSSRRLERHVLKTCVEHVFSVTIFHLPRRLEDVLQRLLEDISQDVLKMSGKTKNCYAEDVLKTCLEDVLKTCLENIFKTSWRQKKWEYLYLTNLNVCVSYKSLFHNSMSDKSKANPKSLIRTQ